MIETLKVIALLCQVSSGGKYDDAATIERMQRVCQVELVGCVLNEYEKVNLDKAALFCTLKRGSRK